MHSFKQRAMIVAFGVASLAFVSPVVAADKAMPMKPRVAVAEVMPTQGNTAQGKIEFEPKGDKVRVKGKISGLPPNSTHGFHVHEKGDCSAPDGTSAGGHFNPAKVAHGHGMQRHVGDLPNLVANDKGVAEIDYEVDLISLQDGSPNDIIERAVIVHANPDDYASQPTGNAGSRIGCGVIKARK